MFVRILAQGLLHSILSVAGVLSLRLGSRYGLIIIMRDVCLALVWCKVLSYHWKPAAVSVKVNLVYLAWTRLEVVLGIHVFVFEDL